MPTCWLDIVVITSNWVHTELAVVRRRRVPTYLNNYRLLKVKMARRKRWLLKVNHVFNLLYNVRQVYVLFMHNTECFLLVLWCVVPNVAPVCVCVCVKTVWVCASHKSCLFVHLSGWMCTIIVQAMLNVYTFQCFTLVSATHLLDVGEHNYGTILSKMHFSLLSLRITKTGSDRSVEPNCNLNLTLWTVHIWLTDLSCKLQLRLQFQEAMLSLASRGVRLTLLAVYWHGVGMLGEGLQFWR